MPTNDFLPFASSGTANVLPQAAYVALAARAAGFSSGIAKSQELNKVWRQSSLIANAVARVIAEIGGTNAVDDGTTDELVAGIVAAMKATCLPRSGGVLNGSISIKGDWAYSQLLNEAGFQTGGMTSPPTGGMLFKARSGTANASSETGPNLELYPDGRILWNSGFLGVPPGVVSHFAGAGGAPAGWLKCNGAAVSRSTYAALWQAIGTTFGAGDGSTTFNLPDLRGEFIRGLDDGRGVDTGRAFGSWQADELKSHTHTYKYPDGAGVTSSAGTATASTPSTPPSNTSATGGAETRPRNIALLACIKF